jgi:hypothetical protein
LGIAVGDDKLAPEVASIEKSWGAIENSDLIVVAVALSSIRAMFSCVHPAFAGHAVMKRTTVAMNLTGFIIRLLLLFIDLVCKHSSIFTRSWQEGDGLAGCIPGGK